MTDTSTNATQLALQNQEWRSALMAEIATTEERFIRNKNRWNFWYYTGLYSTVILPALATLILKANMISDVTLKNDLGAISAALGAIVATAMIAGNFRKRWAISRVARTELHSLRVEALNPDTDLALIESNLKKIIAKYNNEVINDES